MTNREQAVTGKPVTKDFPVFDCDAHVNDPYEIWEKYVEPSEREIVRQTYWKGRDQAILNGRTLTRGGDEPSASYQTICIGGPGNDKRILRRLQQMRLSEEQKEYLRHRGAYEPRARLRDMDLMGIDQVMIIPTHMISNTPFADSADGLAALARAYNDWVHDFRQTDPKRLYGAGLLPVNDPQRSAVELERIAKRDFRVALIRPIDAKGRYPNQLVAGVLGIATFDRLYRAFEDTGLVLGMHTFPAMKPEPAATMASPGELLSPTANGTGRYVDMQTLSFAFEAMTWLAQVLLSGFLDRYRRLRMAIFESNGSWLPSFLAHLDRLFRLYRSERAVRADRLPSEAFYEQCFIAFESDETPVFRQWRRFEEIGVWSSDAYHHDGADAWSAIREMRAAGVPDDVQAKLMGANARRMYGIEGVLCTRTEPASIERPDWYPKADAQFDGWWERESHPRRSRTATSKGGDATRAGEPTA